ncbi:MAG: triose-phosphate isomerase [Candidatus Eremiobacteraeota bacterium]|nr:triose-phosphate isomerase [Candidatus Eremiobacteraeota bacterium]
MSRTIFAANWKMHKTAADTAAFLDAFLPKVAALPQHVEIIIAPPFLSVPSAWPALRNTRVRLGAQTMHWELEGAFTGEISAPMLREFGVSHVILGHSERRAHANETDETVRLKVRTALDQGITPIVAVGETQDQRKAGITQEHVVGQTRAALHQLSTGDLGRVILAYEPIWAIGTGQNCAPEEAQRVMAAIRGCLEGLNETPILYGGSMNAQNVAGYVAQPDINGGLVGGASLDPEGFANLIASATT